MTTDLTLTEKREELKRKLAAGEYKTLVDVCLEWLEHLLRKIARRKEPLSLWITSSVLILIAGSVGFGVIQFGGDSITIPGAITQLSTTGNFFIFLLLGGQAIVSVIIINQFLNEIFIFLHDKLLDSIQSTENLDSLKDWLEIVCNKRQHLLLALFGGTFAGLYARSVLGIQLFSFISYGLTFTLIAFSVFSSAFIYLLYAVLLLAGKVCHYNVELFRPDPSSSELISRLSSKLNTIVYIVGVYAAVMTFVFAALGLLTSASIILVLGLWIPIIALFILNQTSLASIIRRAKWKTLNEIQSQVEELRATNNLKDKETMEAINRLMDFHDRVKATRNSAIDLRTVLNFINSLLLPLLAFLLGNLDKVLLLFSKKP